MIIKKWYYHTCNTKDKIVEDYKKVIKEWGDFVNPYIAFAVIKTKIFLVIANKTYSYV